MFTRPTPPSRPAIPFGHRVYAIGDVHGEAGLLRQLLRLIEEDNGAHREAVVTIVFLGDIIDRGPDAAALLETLAQMKVDHVVVLKGNHEEALVQAYHGDDEVLDAWMPFGAMATLTGFGITLKEIDSANATFTAALRARIDPDLIAWLDGLPSAWECGGYYFTHAGIRPGVKLDDQDGADLRWIREPFLSSRRDHGKVIVHGHTVEPGVPALGGNRIGIDTGGHEHGVLTALGLEGERQWLLQASARGNRGEVGVATDAVVSSQPRPALDERLPLPDIAALIASIVTPRPPQPDAPLLLTAGRKLADRLASKRGLGKRGYAAVGFALVLASLGGAIAIKSTFSGDDGVAVPIPDGAHDQGSQALDATPALSNDARPARKAGERQHRRWTRTVTARPSTPEADAASPAAVAPDANAASPRLYGDALAKALEEDRANTRRLNQDELSRQQEKRDIR